MAKAYKEHICRIIISGCNGYMGRAVSSLCSEDEGIKVVAGFDINLQRLFDYPVYQSPEEYIGEADVLIDFSHPDALVPLLDYCVKRGIPVVLCTTGYTDTHLSISNPQPTGFPYSSRQICPSNKYAAGAYPTGGFPAGGRF